MGWLGPWPRSTFRAWRARSTSLTRAPLPRTRAAKGLFTTTDPETRRVVPENENGRVRVKMVYVVLEAQYQSAISQAVQKINATNGKVCFEVVGYLLEELRDKKNFELFQKDLSDANMFIGSLIFIEELAEKVRHRAGAGVRGCTGRLAAGEWPRMAHNAWGAMRGPRKGLGGPVCAQRCCCSFTALPPGSQPGCVASIASYTSGPVLASGLPA